MPNSQTNVEYSSLTNLERVTLADAALQSVAAYIDLDFAPGSGQSLNALFQSNVANPDAALVEAAFSAALADNGVSAEQINLITNQYKVVIASGGDDQLILFENKIVRDQR